MSPRIGPGARVRTTVELPVANSTDDPCAPVGTEGTVRRVFADALGGFQVDLTIAGAVIPAVVYENQIVLVDPPAPRDGEDSARTTPAEAIPPESPALSAPLSSAAAMSETTAASPR